MWKYHCLNPISQVGLQNFSSDYERTEQIEDADAVLVRSAAMHEMELPKNTFQSQEPEPVSTIFRLKSARSRVSWYSIPREQMRMQSRRLCLPVCCLHPVISWAVLNG